MQENNLHRDLSKENTTSIVSNLYSRNDGMASIYRQLSADVNQENLKTWFSSLAKYRQTLADELRPLVEANAAIPQKASLALKPYLKDHENTLTNFIHQKNNVGLISLSLEAEESIAEYFRKVEGNKNIPIKIRQLLEKQYNRTSKVIAKARRLKSVPADQNLSFKLE